MENYGVIWKKDEMLYWKFIIIMWLSLMSLKLIFHTSTKTFCDFFVIKIVMYYFDLFVLFLLNVLYYFELFVKYYSLVF